MSTVKMNKNQTQTVKDQAKTLQVKADGLTKLNSGLNRQSQRSKGPYHHGADSSTIQTKHSNPAKGNSAKGNLVPQKNLAKGSPANPKASSLGPLSQGGKN